MIYLLNINNTQKIDNSRSIDNAKIHIEHCMKEFDNVCARIDVLNVASFLCINNMRVLKPGRKYYQVIIMKAYMMANKAQTYENTIFLQFVFISNFID